MVLWLALLTPAHGFSPTSECPAEGDRAKLESFRDRLAEAPTPAAARELALSKVRLGHRAISLAGRTLPGDPGIAEAEARLSAFEAGIATSADQAEVAAQFDALIQRTGMNCSYTTVEVVVVVVGFVLGILPGIIFLFLFC